MPIPPDIDPQCGSASEANFETAAAGSPIADDVAGELRENLWLLFGGLLAVLIVISLIPA